MSIQNLNDVVLQEIETGSSKFHQAVLKKIPLDALQQAVCRQANVLKEAKNEVLHPQYTPSHGVSGVYSRNAAGVFHRFFPNLLNTVYTALNYFDEGHQPEMIWDCYLLLDVYYKVFTIPVALTFAIGAVVAPTAAAAAVAAAVSIVGLGALYVYARWFRSFPAKLNYGITRIDRQSGAPIVGRDEEIQDILKFHSDQPTLSKKHILIIGDPGTGKTATLQKAARRLIEKYPRYAVYDASCAPPAKSGRFNSGPFARVEDGMKQLGSLEERSVFIIDELLSYVKDSEAAGKLKNILDKRTGTVWASGTVEDLKVLKKIDEDKGGDASEALLQRFHVIDLRNYPVSDKMMKAMVSSYLLFHKEYILCDSNIAEEAIRLAAQTGISQPRSACELINQGLAAVKANLNAPGMTSQELKNAQIDLDEAVTSFRLFDPIKRMEEGADSKIEELKGRVKKIEDSLSEKRQCVKKVERLCRSIHRDQRQLSEVARKIVSGGNPLLAKEFLYLKFWSLPMKYFEIKKYESKIGEDYPVRLTAGVLKEALSKQMANG